MGKFKGGKRSDRPQMHQAVCDECGRNCEVPFKPSGDKPIYCERCFQSKGGDNKKSGRRDFGDRHLRQHAMHQAVCDSCGRNCEVPFKPTSGKPIYCDNCFKNKDGKKDRGGDNEQVNKQLEILNNKIDSIFKLLSPSEQKPESKSKTKDIKKKKPAKVKKAAPKKIPAKKKPAQKKPKAKKKKK